MYTHINTLYDDLIALIFTRYDSPFWFTVFNLTSLPKDVSAKQEFVHTPHFVYRGLRQMTTALKDACLL